MTQIRVAFLIMPTTVWAGGYNYILNLCSALAEYMPEQITPVLFCGEDSDPSDVAPLLEVDGLEVIQHAAFDRGRRSILLGRAFLFGSDAMAEEQFELARIDVIFESATYFGRKCGPSTIAWFPDFQHRILKDRFNLRAYFRRELGFRAQIANGRSLLLSSEDARKDCHRFYPTTIGKTQVLHFPAPLDAEMFKLDTTKLQEKYDLPEKFVYLPNQFSTHKNHILVIEALGLLKERGDIPCVIATGHPHDPRSPDHFAKLQERTSQLGLGEHFRMLGLIPRPDVVGLMRICTLLLNPSLFEGWSTTVEEARAIEVPMLLSDLGVNKEQMGDEASYFERTSAQALADNLSLLMQTTEPPKSPRILPAQTRDGRRHFAQSFYRIAKQAHEA